MFAGAAREAVFSRPEVIRRIGEDFVPVALKAGLVANPPPSIEGRLYREIKRSQPAPQGIAVANSDGRLLHWAMSFDDEDSIGDFLSYSLERYAKHPDASRPVATERYMRFPSRKLNDVADRGPDLQIPHAHTKRSPCPAERRVPKGTVIARLVGRTLEENGRLSNRTNEQEHYVEDLFDVPPELQSALARALTRAGSERVAIPDALARLLVHNTYLGQLDVAPSRAADDLHVELWVRRMEDSPWLRLEGSSRIKAGVRQRRGDGASFRHEIELTWEGFFRMEGERMTELVLLARGTEKLQWGNRAFRSMQSESDCAHLMAGSPIDLACEVRYGIVGRPAPPEQTLDEAHSTATAPWTTRGRNGPPATLHRKMERLQMHMRQRERSGGAPPEIGAAMRAFQRHLRAGRFDQAEAALDRALAAVQGGGEGRPAPKGSPEAVQRKLRALHTAIRELLVQGKIEEAEAALDKVLELLGTPRRSGR